LLAEANVEHYAIFDDSSSEDGLTTCFAVDSGSQTVLTAENTIVTDSAEVLIASATALACREVSCYARERFREISADLAKFSAVDAVLVDDSVVAQVALGVTVGHTDDAFFWFTALARWKQRHALQCPSPEAFDELVYVVGDECGMFFGDHFLRFLAECDAMEEESSSTSAPCSAPSAVPTVALPSVLKARSEARGDAT
jgi:hypothetical protein